MSGCILFALHINIKNQIFENLLFVVAEGGSFKQKYYYLNDKSTSLFCNLIFLFIGDKKAIWIRVDLKKSAISYKRYILLHLHWIHAKFLT